MSGFRTKHIFCCQVTWTQRTISSGVAHPLSTVCKGHCTLWSALPGFQWFQQDGATPHSPNESLAWLQQRFLDRLISRRCDQQWSPYSPDLNPPDFYMWGYLKDRVYGNNPQTIPDLKAAITAAIRPIPREECGRVIENFARRIQMCLQRRGAHLEHIFWAPVKQRVFVEQTWNLISWPLISLCPEKFVLNIQ